jgi:hypothetical protein
MNGSTSFLCPSAFMNGQSGIQTAKKMPVAEPSEHLRMQTNTLNTSATSYWMAITPMVS